MNWRVTQDIPYLATGAIQVWRLELPGMQWASAGEDLDEKEQSRAQRFHFDKDRRNFIFIRSGLRKLLSAHTGVSAKEIEFDYNVHGKPSLSKQAFNTSNIHFNVSHSQDMALISLCKGYEIGVDVEFMRKKVDFLKLSKRFFSSSEAEYLANLPAREQRVAFFQIWTLKEAFIKAVGIGITFPLSGFSINIENPQPALACVHNSRYDGECKFMHLPCPEDYTASLACLIPTQKTDLAVFLYHWPLDMDGV